MRALLFDHGPGSLPVDAPTSRSSGLRTDSPAAPDFLTARPVLLHLNPEVPSATRFQPAATGSGAAVHPDAAMSVPPEATADLVRALADMDGVISVSVRRGESVKPPVMSSARRCLTPTSTLCSSG